MVNIRRGPKRTMIMKTMVLIYSQVDLGWDSPLTWVLTAIFLDLGYYAFHRASHEVGPINRVGW